MAHGVCWLDGWTSHTKKADPLKPFWSSPDQNVMKIENNVPGH